MPLLWSHWWLIFAGYVADVSSILDYVGWMVRVLSLFHHFASHCTLAQGHANKTDSINICLMSMKKKRRRKREKGGKNTRANNGYWQLQNEAVWIPCKLPNNVVINYKLPLGSWAHPCCFPLQYAADDVCDYKLVLGTCSVWKDGLLLLISSTPCGSIIPSQSGIYANTFWDLSKEISLPGRCVGPAVHRCMLVSWSWDIKASMHWLS